MIIKPIIPIWIMIIFCIIFIAVVIFNNLTKKNIFNLIIKSMIVVFLFIINLRPMLPNGESTAINADINIMFVIDKSVSMKALDYNGKNRRMDGVINDCCYITEELSGCKFSIITFGDTAQKIIPFTNDSDMVQAELKSINVEDDFYAKGSSLNLIKDFLEKNLEKEKEKNRDEVILFFISDGEITKEGEKLEDFSKISKYVSNGAILGYGTKSGGKMIRSIYEDQPSSSRYYVSYYDENYNSVDAISKLDEDNLKQIASDLKVDYIQMNKKSKIDDKIDEIKEKIADSQSEEERMNTYKDIYYYFSIPLAILLIIDLSAKKRRM